MEMVEVQEREKKTSEERKGREREEGEIMVADPRLLVARGRRPALLLITIAVARVTIPAILIRGGRVYTY